MVLVHIYQILEGKETILEAKFGGGARKRKPGAMKLQQRKGLLFIVDDFFLLQASISINPHHLCGLERLPFEKLTLMPAIIVDIALEVSHNIFMNSAVRLTVYGFVCIGGNAI
jgi:hypothetical protein